MTHPTYNFKKMILVGGTMFAMLAVPLAVNSVTGLDLGVISAAHAAEDGGTKKGSANKGGAKKGSANKGGQGQGGASSNKIFGFLFAVGCPTFIKQCIGIGYINGLLVCPANIVNKQI